MSDDLQSLNVSELKSVIDDMIKTNVINRDIIIFYIQLYKLSVDPLEKIATELEDMKTKYPNKSTIIDTKIEEIKDLFILIIETAKKGKILELPKEKDNEDEEKTTINKKSSISTKDNGDDEGKRFMKLMKKLTKVMASL